MDTLRDGLLQLCIELLSLDGQIAVVRTDPLPGFQDLVATLLKKTHRIVIEIGRILNKNKYPVAKFKNYKRKTFATILCLVTSFFYYKHSI